MSSKIFTRQKNYRNYLNLNKNISLLKTGTVFDFLPKYPTEDIQIKDSFIRIGLLIGTTHPLKVKSAMIYFRF